MDDSPRDAGGPVFRYSAEPCTWRVEVSARVALEVLELPLGGTVALVLVDERAWGVIAGAEA